jgi:hypothetical protein
VIKGVGQYQILDPEETLELASRLGRRGWLLLNPRMSGIAPDVAWKMLRVVEERVLPHLADSAPK